MKCKEETKKKISKTLTGRKRPPLSKEWKEKISKGGKGKKRSIKTREKISLAKRGAKNHFWRGGITPLRILIKQSYKYRQWRSDVYTRDNFVCQTCRQRGGKINADHIKSFSLIIFDNNIKTLEEALDCEELWNINNGRTLCEECHKKTDNFGNKGRVRKSGWGKTSEIVKTLQ
jgi:5-methylcytosine-specific restriction endonuclease McrA